MGRAGSFDNPNTDERVKVKVVESDESTQGYTTDGGRPQRVDTTDDAWTGSVWQEGEDGGVMEDESVDQPAQDPEELRKAETPPPSLQRLRADVEKSQHIPLIAETPFIAAVAGIAAFALTVLAAVALMRAFGLV